MKRIVLVSCASKKRAERTFAKDLYNSQLFRLNLEYAHQLRPDVIFILSAKHGLLSLEEEIDRYDLTLNTMKSGEVKVWAEKVLQQMAVATDIQADHFIFLAGERYRKHLAPCLTHVEVPMQGLPIGKQLQWLKRQIKT